MRQKSVTDYFQDVLQCILVNLLQTNSLKKYGA